MGSFHSGTGSPSPQSGTRSAGDALLQSIDLAVAAEELGADGAYVRVHHFARQLAAPFPLLAAIGARTKSIEIGTAVIDMRYENPLYMAEDAGSADLISNGRLQLGISRGSPEQVIDGWRYFGLEPQDGASDADMARAHTQAFLEVLKGQGFAQPNPRPMFANPPGLLRLEPHSGRLARAHLVGCELECHGDLGCQARHEPAELDVEERRNRRALSMSSRPRRSAPTAKPSRRQAMRARRACRSAAAFSRLVDDRDRAYFGGASKESDTIGYIDDQTRAIFGRSYAAEPEALIRQLAEDEGNRGG